MCIFYIEISKHSLHDETLSYKKKVDRNLAPFITDAELKTNQRP